MAFVPGYENDVFISYAHADNDPTIAGKPGWVDFFEDLLIKRVRTRMRGEISFFRDQKLRLYGKFSDQLGKELASSAVMLCLPSPNYVESDWCLWELEQFSRLNGTDRIIKVVKTEVVESSLNPKARSLFEPIKHVLECRFYKRDESADQVIDLMPEVIPDHIPECIQKIDAIAQNLVELLRSLAAMQPQPAVVAASSQETPTTYIVETDKQVAVFLAETTRDLASDRNKVKNELIQFNYRVLPDQPLPQSAEEMATAVREYLSQAKLSVHLIGTNYGTVLDGEERSVPHVQYDLAREMSKENKLIQIVWLPNGLALKEGSSQEAFVKHVRDTSPDYLQVKLEDLKTEIQKKLKPPMTDAWEGTEGDTTLNVCMFCHEQDVKSVGPIYSYLKLKESFKVKIPLKDAQSFDAQKQILQSSDAVILYYGTPDEDWFVNRWKLIQRQSAAGRTKPMRAMAIIAGEPPTTEKELLESDDPMVLKIFGPFRPDSLAPFIAKLKGGAK